MVNTFITNNAEFVKYNSNQCYLPVGTTHTHCSIRLAEWLFYLKIWIKNGKKNMICETCNIILLMQISHCEIRSDIPL